MTPEITSAMKVLLERAREHGYLVRGEADASLRARGADHGQIQAILESFGDLGIAVFNASPTQADLDAFQAKLRLGDEERARRELDLWPTEPATWLAPVAKPLTVLRVGAEGGILRLLGQQLETGWRFLYTLLDQRMRWIGEADAETRRLSPWVTDWPAALRMLDRYPWARLRPIESHPDFRDAVLQDVRVRLATERGKPAVRSKLRSWENISSEGASIGE